MNKQSGETDINSLTDESFCYLNIPIEILVIGTDRKASIYSLDGINWLNLRLT